MELPRLVFESLSLSALLDPNIFTKSVDLVFMLRRPWNAVCMYSLLFMFVYILLLPFTKDESEIYQIQKRFHREK